MRIALSAVNPGTPSGGPAIPGASLALAGRADKTAAPDARA